MDYIIGGIMTFVFLAIGGIFIDKPKPEIEVETKIVAEIAAEPAANNEMIIYSPEVFQKLFHDLMTTVINNQEQQHIQFKMIQAQIDFIHTTFFYCGVGFFTLIVCGFGYYFLSTNINIPEIGNNIYTQLNNQYMFVSNQIYGVFNRIIGIPNIEIPVVQAELINQNIQQIDNRFLDIITEDVVNNIQNQEIDRLLDIILNDRALAYIIEVANTDVTNAHIIGQILLQNNGII